MSGKEAESSYSLFQINSQDAWVVDDFDYLNIISPKKKTAQKVLDLHKKESILASKENGLHDVNNLTISTKTNDSVPCTSNHTQFGKYAPGMGVRLRASPDGDYSLKEQGLLDQGRIQRFKACISASITDLRLNGIFRPGKRYYLSLSILEKRILLVAVLQQISWSGIPGELRTTVWKLLCNYLPISQERRMFVLTEKRRQYALFIRQYFHLREQPSSEPMFHQIQKDLNRMTLLYRNRDLIEMFERILFIWSTRHPGSGYVQGINDLLIPFVVVFLSEYTHVDIKPTIVDGNVDLNTSGELCFQTELEREHLDAVEADVFWCTTHLLDTIQHNYTFAQPGIQNSVSMLASLIERINLPLYQHFVGNGIEFLQFSFRWMNNLLLRELPLRCIIRLWDTYMSEKSGFSTFHVYVCAAFLLQFSAELMRQKDFQSLMVMLQHLPTYHWTDEHIDLVLAEAFRLYSLFNSALHHLDFRPYSGLD